MVFTKIQVVGGFHTGNVPNPSSQHSIWIWFQTHLILSNPSAFTFSLHHHKRTRRTQPYRPYFLCYYYFSAVQLHLVRCLIFLFCVPQLSLDTRATCVLWKLMMSWCLQLKHTHTHTIVFTFSGTCTISCGFGTAPRFLIRLAAFTFSCEYSMVCFRPVCWCESSLQDLWSLSRRIV